MSANPLHQARPAARTGRGAALGYLSGFGNEFATEALPGALPVGQNSPQRCPYGLYAEQLSGTAFTAPRAANRRTWTVPHPARRDAPAVPAHRRRRVVQRAFGDVPPTPNQLRWDPLPHPERADRLRRRPGDDGRQRRPGRAGGLRRPHVRRQPLDDRPRSSTTPTASC